MIDFIQIGANIGKHPNDPIWPLVQKGWRGICIEPIPHSFIKLQQCYKNIEGCFLEQVAISDKSGEATISWCEQDESQQASMYNTWHTNNQTVIVKAVTLDDICVTYDLIGVPFKLLQIDAEGADGVIIVSTDFERVQPEYVRYEFVHIGGHGCPTPSKNDVATHLGSFGYKVVDDKFNIPNPGYKGKPIDVLYRRLK